LISARASAPAPQENSGQKSSFLLSLGRITITLA
jgi:hypothetical protein